MVISIRAYIPLVLLMVNIAHQVSAAELYGTSFFTPRSQSTDAARALCTMHRFMHLPKQDFYSAGELTFAYERSFRPARLAEFFFGREVLSISGSMVEEHTNVDILADYFGLSPAFSSTVLLHPRIQNVIGDFTWFGQYHNWYVWAHMPLSWQKVTFTLDERVEQDGASVPYPAGYMSPEELQAPYRSWTQAMQGTTGFGDVQQLKFGKIPCNSRSKFGVAALELCVGYDLVLNDSAHAGFNLRMAAPTGNRPTSEFLLTPIIGNGKHWELGLGFTGHVQIWEKDGEQWADFLCDINAVHIFNTHQIRSFDLQQRCRGFGTRYMLLKQFDEQGIYTGTSLPVINVTSLRCQIHNAIQFDIVFAFGYQQDGFGFDIGYNAWVRSADQICLKEDPFADQKFGIKGIQNVVNADTTTDSTQSTATLTGSLFVDQALVADPNPPVFVPAFSINVSSAASPLQFTNAIFWNFSYRAKCYPRISPFGAFGGKVEFEGVRPKCVQANKDSLSQWQLWLQYGVAWG